MLPPTQGAWQESSASRRFSGDPIPILREVSRGGANAQYLSAGVIHRAGKVGCSEVPGVTTVYFRPLHTGCFAHRLRVQRAPDFLRALLFLGEVFSKTRAHAQRDSGPVHCLEAASRSSKQEGEPPCTIHIRFA
jgi:hypothetical protein